MGAPKYIIDALLISVDAENPQQILSNTGWISTCPRGLDSITKHRIEGGGTPSAATLDRSYARLHSYDTPAP